MGNSKRKAELKQRYSELQKENQQLKEKLNKKNPILTKLILEIKDYEDCMSVLHSQYVDFSKREKELEEELNSFPEQKERKERPAFKSGISKEEILRLKSQGMSTSRIAEELGVSRQTVYNRLK